MTDSPVININHNTLHETMEGQSVSTATYFLLSDFHYQVREYLIATGLGRRLSDVPFDELALGDRVISALSNPGKIIGLVKENPKLNARYDTVVIEWSIGKYSNQFHMGCENIIYPKDARVINGVYVV